MDYFSYLGERPDRNELEHRLGTTLDRLMTLDVNLTGRSDHLYSIERRRLQRPISLTLATRLLETVGAGSTLLIVTGCSVRPEIDFGVGEPDGPPGAAAIARAMFMARGCQTIVAVAEQLAEQVEAALRSAGATIVEEAVLQRVKASPKPLFAAAVIGLPVDEDLGSRPGQIFDDHHPSAVLAVEHLGCASDGNAYFSTGKPFVNAVLRSEPIFREAAARGILRACCVDNPNEAGTGRLHSEIARHPPMADSFEHIVPGTIVNWAAYAVAAAIGALIGCPEAAFHGELDEACVRSTIEAGAVDPFSGFADPALGVDTLEKAVHVPVTTLMARTAKGFCSACRAIC